MVPFETWRREIAASLEGNHEALECAMDLLAEAEVAVAAAKLGRREIADALARLGPNPSLTGVVAARIRDHEESLGRADGQLVQCRNRVKLIHARIKDSEDALAQIVQMWPAATHEVAA